MGWQEKVLQGLQRLDPAHPAQNSEAQGAQARRRVSGDPSAATENVIFPCSLRPPSGYWMLAGPEVTVTYR